MFYTNEGIGYFKYYYKLWCFYYNMYSVYCNYNSEKPDYKQIVEFLRESGPLFIKIGQNLMTKSSLPEEFKNELKSLGHENFKNNTENCIAAGSVAYVCKIIHNGQQAIIKKLHENIRQEIITSIHIFENLKYNFGNYPWFNYADSLIEFEELYQDLITQSDLKNEVKNLINFKNIFSSFSNKIIVPSVLDHSEEFIIESFEEGYKLNDFIKLYPELKEEASNLIHCCFYLMFFSNFMHGDLHESNFILRKDDIHGVQMILFDFGIVTKFNSNDIFLKFISLFRANVFFPSQRKIINFLKEVNINENANVDNFIKVSNELLNSLNYEEKIKIMMKGKWNQDDKTMEIGPIFKQILDFALENKLKFTGSILNVCNSFLLIEDYRSLCSGNTSTWKNKMNYAKENGFYEFFEKKINEIIVE